MSMSGWKPTISLIYPPTLLCAGADKNLGYAQDSYPIDIGLIHL